MQVSRDATIEESPYKAAREDFSTDFSQESAAGLRP
jgi:hypothetical protein